MERKKPENVVPQPYHKLFASFDYFNEMQNALLNDLLNTDKSVVLCAPTGSGKTIAFELAIVRMLQNTISLQKQNNCDYILPKAIYIAPIKALCSEKFADWKPRFESVGVVCTQLTGDTEVSNLNAIRKAQVVISTPEKWDSLTRRWRDFEKLLPAVQLFIVDEVHLLNEDMRGPVLEVVIARMKSSGVKRFVVASATIPNAEDLKSWISSGSTRMQVAQYLFNGMQRPVPLEKHVIGFNLNLKGFQFDMRLNYQLPDILRKYAENRASLIFCNSRKSAEMAAFNLNKASPVFSLSENQKSYLNQLAPSISDIKLRKLIENGIAYHHAGLQYADRGLIESSFRQGYLMVLISTSTLAMGINLPARLVVIKSTETYSGGGFTEYPESMLLQMIGRAGRPQYDTKGVAVILTQQKNVKKYQKLLTGTAPIESYLHKYLTEHFNSEIALNTIRSLEMAMVWVRSTYLYIRAVRNPKHYGFDEKLTKDFVEHKLEELCLRQINALKDAGLVRFDPITGFDVQSTVYGQLMTKYYLCYETMKLFQQLNGKESLEDLLKLLVQCKEMSEFTLRVNEKKVLTALNKTPIRFPVKGRIKNCEEKISCIIQAVLGCIEISAPALIQESLKIMRIASRVSKCLLEYVRLRIKESDEKTETPNKWYNAIFSAVTIAKCLHVKLWEDSEYASKQLHGIGTRYSNEFVKCGMTTLKSIAKTEARTIERVLKKSAPFGDEVLKHLMCYPDYELNLERKNKTFVKVHVKQLNEGFIHNGAASAVIIVGDSFNNLLLVEENLNNIIQENGSFECEIKLLQTDEVEHVYGHVVHVSLVGVDAYDVLEINAPKSNAKSKPVVVVSSKSKKPKKKQSRLNFSLDESFFNKTGLSNDSLDLDDNLSNNLKKIKSGKSKKAQTLTMISNNSIDNFNFTDEKKVTNESDDGTVSLLTVDVGDKNNLSYTTNGANYEAKKTANDFEDYRLKKPKMKHCVQNLTFGENTLNNILAEETFNDTLNVTSLTNDESITSKQKRVKQRKLTDFYSKRKKVEQKLSKTNESIDLSRNLKCVESKIQENSAFKKQVGMSVTKPATKDLHKRMSTHVLEKKFGLSEPIAGPKELRITTSTNTNSAFDKYSRASEPKATLQTITSTNSAFENNIGMSKTTVDFKVPQKVRTSTNSAFQKQIEMNKPTTLSSLANKQKTTQAELCSFKTLEKTLLTEGNHKENESLIDNILSGNGENSKHSTTSSSNEIPLTIIPNPKKAKLSDTLLSDSCEKVDVVKPKSIASVSKCSPKSLESFLSDPDLLNKSGPMIKLSEESTQINKKYNRLLYKNPNEFQRTVPMPMNPLKSKKRPLLTNENFCEENFANPTTFTINIPDVDSNQLERITKTLMDNFKESSLTVKNNKRNQIAPLEFEMPKHDYFELSPCTIVEKNDSKKSKPFLDSLDFLPATDDIKCVPKISCFENKKVEYNKWQSKPPIFEITAKYEPKKKRQRFNDNSTTTNFFEKLCHDSPETQNSPLDLSKAAISNNKAKLGSSNAFVSKENKATQTNENQNKINENELKLWHKVALHFRKVPSAEAQSLEKFQLTYNLVRQRQQLKQQAASAAIPNRQPTINTSNVTNNTKIRNYFSNTIGDISHNSSNLKVKQHSSFRLQLFNDKDKSSKECHKLNPHEIKLINQNVMSLVLEQKCEETSNRQTERQIEQINDEMDKLERELGFHNGNVDPFL